ncbi:adenylate kinase [Enterococcus sp. 669A]|uniref:Adenylate kinase n=1 Tax=Candidatus Enterococcus moelleringii TaxID=2815325 RepID=A0ABS3L699_9ENTE|nr:adenylate kinase [Enterococcus sp. 669A]MBO1305105.1 adenylate kinase [Enterococcus sp. 669A]
MIILLTGASHTGKTVMAQKLLETYHYPYLSLDHLKMGLIRSHYTTLTPEDDDQLTIYMWPIVREIIKTAIENQQNLIVEGLYIPFDWMQDFSVKYLEEIQFYCLVMTENYIRKQFSTIKMHANDVEKRLDDSDYNLAEMIMENAENLRQCQKHGYRYILIDEHYPTTIDL